MKRASKQQQSHNLIVNKVYIQSLCIRKKKETKTVFLTQSLKAIYEALSRYH